MWVREERWSGDIVFPGVVEWPGGVAPLPYGNVCGLPTKDNKVAIVQRSDHASAMLTMENTLVVMVSEEEMNGRKEARLEILIDYESGCGTIWVAIYCPEADAFLRDLSCTKDGPWMSNGDLSSLIWDVYGTDFVSIEHAARAIEKAPKPRKPYVEFTLPLR